MPKVSESVQSQVALVMAKVYLDAPDSEIPEKYLAAVHELRNSVSADDVPGASLVRLKKPYRAPTGLKRGENLRGTSSIRHTGSKYPKKLIFEKFDSGMRVSEIAAELNAPDGSIRDIIRRSGRKCGKSGPRPKTHCKRGHDLSVHGKPASNGGRYCAECKRQKERKQ
jgi:hypothetical protein